jgi:CubicO group peptidase (beta-lactamase class C family)
MLRYALTLLGCLAITVCKAATPIPLPGRVDQAIRDRVSAGIYPSVVIAIVDGEHSEIHAFGKADGSSDAGPATAYEIGSITKTFTATLLAAAVTSNDLTLDEPVVKLLPGFTVPARNGKVITLGMLAMQDSGLPRLPTNFMPQRQDDPYVGYDVAKLKTFLASYMLPRDPGQSYEYSNLGVALLGHALAVRAGTGYDKLVQKDILGPLGMRRSGVQLADTVQAGLAPGHDAAGRAVPGWHLDLFAGAGGIVSTGADMLRYLQANMGLLPTSLYPAMQLAQTPKSAGPRPEDRIGLVWMTHQLPDGNIIWHSGMTGGYASFIGFTADRRHGVVILTNAAVPVEDLGFATLDAGWQLRATKKRIATTPEQIEEYVGNYQLSPKLVVRVFRDGNQLAAQGTGQQPQPIFASARDEFYANIDDIALSFTRDASNHVTGMILHQHGDHVAPRISDAAADATQGNTQITLDPTTLEDYIGRYQMPGGALFVVTVQDSQLMARLATQSAFPVFASARDTFFYRVVDAKLDFERDASGKVTAVVLHQNGADHRAVKLAL